MKKNCEGKFKNLFYLLLPYLEEIETRSVIEYTYSEGGFASFAAKEANLQVCILKEDEDEMQQCDFDSSNKADLIICTDIMEHTAPANFDHIVKKALSLGEQAIFIVPAKLVDNNELTTTYNVDWWLDLIKQHTDFAKAIPWPAKSHYVIITWDSYAVGGKLDCMVKFLANSADKFFR